MPIDNTGTWTRRVTWYNNGVARTDIQKNTLESDEFKWASYSLPDGTVVKVSAQDLRRALVNAPTRNNGKTIGPYNIDVQRREINRVSVDLKLLRRSESLIEKIYDVLEDEGAFSISSIQDGREKKLRAIVQRRGQQNFRQKLIDTYVARCAISGCKCIEVLEAAHIIPYNGEETNHVQNGLLLRSDLHTLFDLGLLTVSEDYIVHLSDSVNDAGYLQYNGRRLFLPEEEKLWPSVIALRKRQYLFKAA